MHKSGFSRQRMRVVALQRDEILRATFASEVSIYNADMFIFVDETGTDRRDMLMQEVFIQLERKTSCCAQATCPRSTSLQHSHDEHNGCVGLQNYSRNCRWRYILRLCRVSHLYSATIYYRPLARTLANALHRSNLTDV